MTNLKPNDQRAKLAISLIFVVMIIRIVSLYSDTLELQLLHSGFSQDEAEANDLRQRIIGWIYLVAFIVSVVTYINWFRRAYYNLHCRAEYLDYSESAAAYSWFIPFVNWVRPVKIMKELYSETENYIQKHSENYNLNINHNLITIWWTLWIICNILGNIQFRLSRNLVTMDDFINSSIFSMVNSLLSIPLAIFAILVIKEYSKIESLFFTTNKIGDQTELKSYHKIETSSDEENII